MAGGRAPKRPRKAGAFSGWRDPAQPGQLALLGAWRVCKVVLSMFLKRGNSGLSLVLRSLTIEYLPVFRSSTAAQEDPPRRRRSGPSSEASAKEDRLSRARMRGEEMRARFFGRSAMSKLESPSACRRGQTPLREHRSLGEDHARGVRIFPDNSLFNREFAMRERCATFADLPLFIVGISLPVHTV